MTTDTSRTAEPQAPQIEDDDKSGSPIPWLMGKLQEGEAFLAAQSGYSKIGLCIDAIMSGNQTDVAKPDNRLSQTRTNRVARIVEDIAALLTDIKPFWDYSVNNRRFEQYADIYGKLSTMWYQRRNIALRMSDVIKYYCVGGTGYLHVFWDPEIADINAESLDPRSVVPIEPKNYESLENCQGVIIKRRVPINYVKERYKEALHGQTPSPDSGGDDTSWVAKASATVVDIVSPIWKWVKAAKSEPNIPKITTTTLYTCYLKDPRKNESKQERYMGDWETDDTGKKVPTTNWSYCVQPGEALFPQRRMIMWCSGIVEPIYDGPSFYWHGRFPVIKMTLNPFPWTFLGKAPLPDILPLADSLNSSLKIVDDHNSQVANPGSIHDSNNVSQSTFNQFNTRIPGYKIKQNPLAGKGIQIIQPPPLDVSIWKHIEWTQDEMNYLSGIVDMRKMMNLGQMPSNETVQTMLNSLSPSLRFRSRILESFVTELATILTSNFSQFYPIDLRVAMLGPGGITQEDFDYDAGSMIPDYVHSTDLGADGQPTAAALARGPMPRLDRAREFLRYFIFKVTPGSLLNSAQVEQKLIYLQLARAGWMDIYTLWEILGIPNIGTLPDNVRTIPQRLKWQQEQGLTGDVNPAGRKASGQELPRITTKES